MNVQVTEDGDHIVFSRDFDEFYDIGIEQIKTYMQEMRLKTWFTPDVENKAVEIVNRATSGSKRIENQ